MVLFNGVRTMTMDFRSCRCEIEMDDGSRTGGSFAHTGNQPVTKAVYRPAEALLTLTLANMGDIDAEVAPLEPSSPGDRRPVVYLDQKDWINLARSVHNPAKVPSSERAPAGALVALARAKRVIMPLSEAHLTETARTGGRWRHDLASVMLELSRGWQMRSPVAAVRHTELRAMLRPADTTQASPVPAVFTLDPWAISGKSVEHNIAPASGQPPGFDELRHRLTWLQAVYSVLAEDDPADHTEALAIAAEWAVSHQALADHMRIERRTRPHRRDITRTKVIADLGTDLALAAAAARITAPQLAEWLKADAENSFRTAPYLGRAREVVHQRLINADDRWEANDLNDLHHLSCAAGYADVVVGESKVTNYLRRATPMCTPGAAVFPSLALAMPKIRSLIGK